MEHGAALMASGVAMPSSWSGIEGRQGLSEEGGVLQRGRACALEWGGDGAQQGSSGAAAGSASARGSGAASGRQRRMSSSVRTRALCARGINAERRKGREKGDLVSGLTHFKLKIFN